MKHHLNLLAFDMGASNGRGILGKFDGEKIVMEELHRFENNYIDVNGVLYWDILGLFQQLKNSLTCFKTGGHGDLASFGVDTWGVDYGLLDKNGQLLGNPRSYRHSTDADMEDAWNTVDFPTLFSRTGIGPFSYNTLYQLYRRKLDGDPALDMAETMLFTPDLLGYFLSGEKKAEYSITTTSGMYNASARSWDYETLKAFGLPTKILPEIDFAGTVRGELLPSIAEELGVNRAKLCAVGCHDTASAVAAIPGSGNFAFCSSGTWSLFGVETDNAILTDAVRDAGFSNEGTVQGNFRPLSNMMGLWLIQECRKQWSKAGNHLSWNDIVEAAKTAPPLRSIIDAGDTVFFGAGDMIGRIQTYCKNSGQPVPETVGEIARSIYESLALKYRWTMERLEEIKGCPLDTLNIVGGGIQNKLLNQMVADSIDRPVITGPIEGAAIGNLLTQAMALGEIKNLEELRQVVRNSEPVQVYTPNHSQIWDDAYETLLKISKK